MSCQSYWLLVVGARRINSSRGVKMSYDAKVFRVLIASPSDVIDEREIAVKTIQEWNDLNSAERQIVLLPLRWETHTAPEYGKRPQEVINRQIVDHCDLLIGIFWTRIGSPTGVKESGTLEEIDRVASSGKPVMLYFSKAKKDPDDIDTEQLLMLRDFKSKTYPKALVEHYSTQVEFRDKLAKQIEMQLRNLLNDSASGDSGSFRSDILLEFADAHSGDNIGSKLGLNAEYLKITDFENIPDYGVDSEDEKVIRNKDGSIMRFYNSGARKNKDYYRDFVDYVVAEKMFSPVDFWLKNQGALGAKDLYIDINVESDNDELVLLSSSEYEAKKPARDRGDTFTSLRNFGYDGISIDKVDGKRGEWKLSFELNALQPKREICPDEVVYIGSNRTCLIKFGATIYADSLPEPIRHELEVDFKVTTIEVSGLDILKESEVMELKESA